MYKFIRVSILSVLCFALLGSATASAAVSFRVTKNEFGMLESRLESARNSGQVVRLIVKMGAICKKLEIPDTGGCRGRKSSYDAVKYLKDSWKRTQTDNPVFEDALPLFKDEFLSQVDDFESQYVDLYGSDEQDAATLPLVRPYDVYKNAPDPERANSFGPARVNQGKQPIAVELENPFDPLIEWVNCWKECSFYPTAVRKNRLVGAPVVWQLAEKYCIKLELYYVGGCPEEIQTLKDKVKTYAKDPSKNESLDSIVSAYNEVLRRLATTTEERYFGDERSRSEDPGSLQAGENPFEYRLKVYNWWDNGSFFPSVVREKFGPAEVKSLRGDCSLFSNPVDRDLCQDETDMTVDAAGRMTSGYQGTLASKLRKCDKCQKYIPNTKKNSEAEAAKAFEIEISKGEIVDTFKEVVGRYAERYAEDAAPEDEEY